MVGISANVRFSQQAFADFIKLNYPLVSDAPEGKTSQAYGVYNSERKIAQRAWFIIDKQGVVRYKKVLAPKEPLVENAADRGAEKAQIAKMRDKKLFGISTAAAVVAGRCFFLHAGTAHAQAAGKRPSTTRSSQAAGDEGAPARAGFTITPRTARKSPQGLPRDKVVFMNFWATWCEGCGKRCLSMERLYKEFQGQGPRDRGGQS